MSCERLRHALLHSHHSSLLSLLLSKTSRGTDRVRRLTLMDGTTCSGKGRRKKAHPMDWQFITCTHTALTQASVSESPASNFNPSLCPTSVRLPNDRQKEAELKEG